MFVILQKNFHAVEFKEAALPHLADLVAVEEFELTGTFVVVVLDGDAASPFLNLARASPEADVNRLWTVEHQAGVVAEDLVSPNGRARAVAPLCATDGEKRNDNRKGLKR